MNSPASVVKELLTRAEHAEAEVERLRAVARKWRSEWERHHATIGGLNAEIERLQAIVDKLPKTADGVSVVPMTDNVYVRSGPFVLTLTVWASGNCCLAANAMSRVHRVSDCYSTRESAEKARDA